MNGKERPQTLEPVHADEAQSEPRKWAFWLMVYLRTMAAVSLIKGLYHWGVICGINAPYPSGFEAYSVPYQVATVFFAVIDPVAGVGLWLAAPWGAVLWLTSVISMATVEVLFPQIFGGSLVVVVIEMVLLAVYLLLTVLAAREQPE
jgi:hypothetical protein